ncbi:substrate-binding domain-containing protein [Sorangium sp. So ce327]|uniref:substrate-binding domain-containing protein n=1 Tax=Sorangium sp. So ce327 TaxID=3133301 RepID=UPI003F60984B
MVQGSRGSEVELPGQRGGRADGSAQEDGAGGQPAAGGDAGRSTRDVNRLAEPPPGGTGVHGMRRGMTVGVITPYLDGSFWNPVLTGIHEAARKHGCRMLVMRGTAASLQAPSLAREQVDGWIVVIGVDGIEQLAAARVPLVVVGTHVHKGDCPSVIPDNHSGIRGAVRHLIGHGHRRIAFVGCFHESDVRERFDAYRETLAEAGIPLDPELVIRTDDNWYTGGENAAPQLIALRNACTAAVFGTDKNAIGMMPSLKAAGVRIPEELAIVGFDDVPEAQTSDPPLTTVRQQFEMLGSAACELVVSMLSGETAVPELVLTPNTLIQRISCGCDVVQSFLDEDAAPGEHGGGDLDRRMVELLLAPRPLAPDTPPAAVWPGVALVLEAYEAAIEGAAPPPAKALERAYKQAVDISSDMGTLMAIVRLLRRSHERRRERLGGDAASAQRVESFLDGAHLSIARARLSVEAEFVAQLGMLVRSNHDVGLALVSASQEESMSLSWLAKTSATWACLALREDAKTLVVAGAFSRDGSATPPIGGRHRLEAFPPEHLLPPAAASGALMMMLLPIRTERRDWGVVALMGPTLRELAGDEGTVGVWASLLAAALERGELVQSLSTKNAELQMAYASERTLSETVRELGCPLIPLLPGVLLVPLIGAIDRDRALQVLTAVVEGVGRHEARFVLLDITGVPAVDAQVAHALGQTSRAVALLGARLFLVGVRPELARSLVDVELGSLATYSSLAGALHELTTGGLRPGGARRGAPRLPR